MELNKTFLNNLGFYVYLIKDSFTHIVFYVGKGKDLRMLKHENDIRKGEKPNQGKNLLLWWKLSHCIPEYEIIFYTNNEENAYQKEIEEIDYYGYNNLYNKTFGGDGGSSELTSGKNNPMYGRCAYDIWLEKYGKEYADKRRVETIEKIRKNQPNRVGENNPMYGKKGWTNGLTKETDERVKKISNTLKGRPLTEKRKEKIRIEVKKAIQRPEIREKISKSTSGENHPMYGKHHSEKTKQLMKIKAKGRYTLKWFIERYGEINGKNLYECKKISMEGENHPMFDKHFSEKTKKLQSEKAKLRWQNPENKKKQIEIMKSYYKNKKENKQ